MTTRTIIGFSFLLLGIIFLLKLVGIVEAFGVEEDAAARAAEGNYEIVNEQAKCGAKTSCGTCLDTAGCGWCPSATPTEGKCIPKVNNYPVIPGVNANGTGAPLYKCPMQDVTEGGITIRKFVAKKEDCTDFLCSSLVSCRDCAGNAKCGWCGSTNKCFPKGANDSLTLPAGETCAAGKAVTNSGNCPTRICNTITDCEECTSTPGCSFCEEANKCVRFQAKAATTINGVAVPAEAKDAAIEGCNEESALSAPSQCPGRRTATSLQNVPTPADIASAQDNTVGGSGEAGPVQAPVDSSSPVSPAQVFTMMTAPGVAIPLGSSTVGSSYPAAAGLDGTGPFERYVQMLVKSELAAQGVPTVEPFAVPSIVDTVRNATKEVKASMRKVFKPHMGVRI